MNSPHNVVEQLADHKPGNDRSIGAILIDAGKLKAGDAERDAPPWKAGFRDRSQGVYPVAGPAPARPSGCEPKPLSAQRKLKLMSAG